VNGLAVAWALLWIGSTLASPARAQLEDLIKPLRQLGNREIQPEQIVLSLWERTEFTEEELKEIERIPIPIKVEREYGEQCVAHYRESLKRQRIRVARRGSEVDYVQQLVDQLHPLMKRSGQYGQLRVFVVESPEVMAWAYPGGTIFVYRGLLDFVPSEAALVGVLGHEISHIDRGHQLFHLKRVEMARRALDPSSFSWQELLASQPLMLKSVARPFRPEEELVADRDGADWAFRLGYDPREMAHLFRQMHQREARQNPQNPTLGRLMVPFLQTHPASDVRVGEISRLSSQLIEDGLKRPLYLGVKNVRQRESRQQNEHPDEYSEQ